MSQDSSRLLDGLPANVIAHQPRLSRRGAHVLGLRPNDWDRGSRVTLPTPSGRRRLGWRFGLLRSGGGLATAARCGPRLLGLGLLGLGVRFDFGLLALRFGFG